MLSNSNAEFVLAVTEFDHPVQRSLKINKKNMLSFAESEIALIRSQDLDSWFHDAGQFFAGRGGAFSRYKTVLFGHCLPLLVGKEQAIGIDNEEDWNLAEILFSIMYQ